MEDLILSLLFHWKLTILRQDPLSVLAQLWHRGGDSLYAFQRYMVHDGVKEWEASYESVYGAKIEILRR